MNLDELQSAQARERQSSGLQHLRSSFYHEVGEYIESLTEERARLVEQVDDPFSSSEVRQLTDDIETAEQTVEAIYERRVGKVVKKASIAAAGMPVDDDGLTKEEEELFEDLVTRIENNREAVLSVLDGDAPSVSCSIDETESAVGESESPMSDAGTAEPGTESAGQGTGMADPGTETTDPSGGQPTAGHDPAEPSVEDSPSDGVSAADLMGSGPETTADSGAGSEKGANAGSGADTETPPASEPGDAGTPPEPENIETSPAPEDVETPPTSENPGTPPTPEEPPASDGSPAASPEDAGRPPTVEAGGTTEEEPSNGDERPAATSSERDIPGIPRTTVRITADIGEVVGADNRDYDLGAEDVVTLPEPNADVLVDKDAAERLE